MLYQVDTKNTRCVGSKEHGYYPKVEVIKVIGAKCAQNATPAKIVVYCSNNVAAEDLAMAIGCDMSP